MSVDAGVNATRTTPEQRRTALKRVAVALKGSGVPFALAGGYAAWVHGAPEPVHDVDFDVRPQDAGRVAEHLREQGFTVEQPPEDWLFKVLSDGVLVDVLHRGGGAPVDDALLARAVVVEVLSVEMPVIAPTDVVTHKLCAFDEHTCDFAPALRVTRSIRESVDWEQVRERTAGRPFAEAFLHLLGLLDVVPPAQGGQQGGQRAG
ncbi:nucleotidyltransferase family protein [Kineococcus sp. SYSU DK006]|uniref:nucleotidyltransferase family protein n=1 Tax=Kineococcus sp. SYSU DK006 TaxID=3383127 RepID=UPI003D7D6640